MIFVDGFCKAQDGKRLSFFLEERSKGQTSREDRNLGEPGKLGDIAVVVGTTLATYDNGKCTSENVRKKHAYT